MTVICLRQTRPFGPGSMINWNGNQARMRKSVIDECQTPSVNSLSRPSSLAQDGQACFSFSPWLQLTLASYLSTSELCAFDNCTARHVKNPCQRVQEHWHVFVVRMKVPPIVTNARKIKGPKDFFTFSEHSSFAWAASWLRTLKRESEKERERADWKECGFVPQKLQII